MSTPTTSRRPPALIGLAVGGASASLLLLVLLIVTAALYADLGKQRDAALDRQAITAAQLRAERTKSASTTALLVSCSAAYTAQKDVSDRLRSSSQDALSAVSDYARTFDNTGFQASLDDTIYDVDRINEDEAAIDPSSCV